MCVLIKMCYMPLFIIVGCIVNTDALNTESANIISKLRDTKPPTTTTATERPCPINIPVKPDFKAYITRVSELQCYEYIWSIKVREERDRSLAKCREDARLSSKQPTRYFVLGGRKTSFGEFPHMAALGWKSILGTWEFRCGGSLISDKFVLTAAHCTWVSSRDTTIEDHAPKIVRLGNKYLGNTPEGDDRIDANITRIIKHPEYHPPNRKHTSYFDIALLELDEAVHFTASIQPACLWSNFDTSPLGAKAIVTGWGVVEKVKRKTSLELQAAIIDVIDSKLCDNLLRPWRSTMWYGVKENQLCEGKLAGGVDSCQGDSGGPLQVKINLPETSKGYIYYVIGVTSFGIGCGRSNVPGIYTRVSSFIDWIESEVWPEGI